MDRAQINFKYILGMVAEMMTVEAISEDGTTEAVIASDLVEWIRFNGVQATTNNSLIDQGYQLEVLDLSFRNHYIKIDIPTLAKMSIQSAHKLLLLRSIRGDDSIADSLAMLEYTVPDCASSYEVHGICEETQRPLKHLAFCFSPHEAVIITKSYFESQNIKCLVSNVIDYFELQCNSADWEREDILSLPSDSFEFVAKEAAILDLDPFETASLNWLRNTLNCYSDVLDELLYTKSSDDVELMLDFSDGDGGVDHKPLIEGLSRLLIKVRQEHVNDDHSEEYFALYYSTLLHCHAKFHFLNKA